MSPIRRRLQWGWRLATRKRRILPDFLIIGAQKCGTSSLYDYCIEHPLVLPSFRKEVHFFDHRYHKGLNWYRASFPLHAECIARGRGGPHYVSGEASPYYLFHPLVPERVAHCLPDARIVAILRDPISRAWSHYQHSLRKGRESLQFGDAVAWEHARLSRQLQYLETGRKLRSFAVENFSYLSRGLYAEQLERWLTFFPQDQILVLCLEELVRDTQRWSRTLFSHLGLSTHEGEKDSELFPKLNIGEYGDHVPASFWDELRCYYLPHNEKLYNMIGRRLPWGE